MNEASFIGFARTILIIIVVYYLIKFLFRIFFPLFMKYMLQKAESNLQQQFRNQNQTTSDFQKNQQTTQNPKAKKVVGEYIDYEEID